MRSLGYTVEPWLSEVDGDGPHIDNCFSQIIKIE